MSSNFKFKSSNLISSGTRYNNDKVKDRYYSIGTGLIEEDELKFGKISCSLLHYESNNANNGVEFIQKSSIFE